MNKRIASALMFAAGVAAGSVSPYAGIAIFALMLADEAFRALAKAQKGI